MLKKSKWKICWLKDKLMKKKRNFLQLKMNNNSKKNLQKIKSMRSQMTLTTMIYSRKKMMRKMKIHLNFF